MSVTTKITYKDLPETNITGVTGLGSAEFVGDGRIDILIEVTGSSERDSIKLNVNKSDINVLKGKESYIFTHNQLPDVFLTTTSVERIEFNDKHLALDVSGAAGEVYSLLCAAFGKSDVTPELMGKYLTFKDGYDVLFGNKADLMLADAILKSTEYKQDAMGSSNETFVKQIYKNVLNQTPSFADLMYFTMELDKGTWTQAQLLEAASNLELTRTNIDLVGIANTGIEFIPPGM